MKRPLLAGVLATSLVVISWGVWSVFETGSSAEFHTRVLVVFMIVLAGLAASMWTIGEPSLAHVPPRLQVVAVIVMAVGTAVFTGWRHPTWADAGDLLMLGVIVGICWRVPAAAFLSARQPVRRRIRRMRGPRLRVVS
jgi:hypothetical protein